MKISLLILLGTVLGAFSLADGYQRTDLYSPHYGFNHPNDPFHLKGHSPKTEWKKPVSSKWAAYSKEMEWKKPTQRKFSSFGQWPNKWFANSPATQAEVPKWKKNAFRFRQSNAQYVTNRPQPQGAIRFVPLPPGPNLDHIQWPDYIPPVTMIKPRLDDPPAALN